MLDLHNLPSTVLKKGQALWSAAQSWNALIYKKEKKSPTLCLHKKLNKP